MNLFERYLSLWVAACMVSGVVLGKAMPELTAALRRMEFGSGSQVNIPIAVLIWLMIIPMMMRVDFAAVRQVGTRPKGLAVTLFVNWVVKPLSMALLSYVAFRWLFAAWIAPAEADQYIAGAIILAATVWNAGPGPLIVEGFRPGRSPRMAAYQFFRRPGSREDGSAVSVGGLDYDARTGHDHWHFRDFARYSLVRANGRTVSVSRKEAWCLAPTDQIDQLVPNAEMRPGDGSLYSACGDADAVQVREVLEVGAGDTYGLGTPGQAIDITHLPDGVYFLKIEANPAGALRDAADGNDVALRRIVLGGSPGHRTVGVPPAEGIDSERSAARLSATCSYCLP